MFAPAKPELQKYNRLVLKFQDRAYTLAVYLVGDVPLAAQLVQEIIQADLPARRQPEAEFEIRLLRSLMQRCLRASPVRGPAPLCTHFGDLALDERLALILIDCLDCSYAQAAAILSWPLQNLQTTLALARRNLSARFAQTRPVAETPAA